MIPLIACPLGTNAVVMTVAAESKLRRRLESMGIVKGAMLEVFVETDGCLLVKVAGAKLGLDRALASCILVAPMCERARVYDAHRNGGVPNENLSI